MTLLFFRSFDSNKILVNSISEIEEKVFHVGNAGFSWIENSTKEGEKGEKKYKSRKGKIKIIQHISLKDKIFFVNKQVQIHPVVDYVLMEPNFQLSDSILDEIHYYYHNILLLAVAHLNFSSTSLF